jgi:4-hydroxythreonine-4-phosphate dehydrogenase
MQPVIAITPGEPAGIGPDLVVQLAQQSYPAQLVAIADPDLLIQRAKILNLALTLKEFIPNQYTEHQPGHLFIVPETLTKPALCGILNPENADYVLRTLTTATQGCLNNSFHALVTGPVHKGIINQAGIKFSGHTEFLADLCNIKQVVMLLSSDQLRVALVTTHLPLKQVSHAISQEKIKTIIPILSDGLKKYFHIDKPYIFVSGLNPHAGEDGHLGDEEINIITPALNTLRTQGYKIEGPLSADTMFSKKNLEQADAFLCMYHDQGLPVIKFAAFGNTANITLGLPFLRTSVDHGTALELAGTGLANVDSFRYALQQAFISVG